MREIETRNAIILGAHLGTEYGLSGWLSLDYGGSQQGFGPYQLYSPDAWATHSGGNYCGHFVYRCLRIAGADDWSKLKGCSIRVRGTRMGIQSIGHIVKDEWFCPAEELKYQP